MDVGYSVSVVAGGGNHDGDDDDDGELDRSRGVECRRDGHSYYGPVDGCCEVLTKGPAKAMLNERSRTANAMASGTMANNNSNKSVWLVIGIMK